LKEENEGFAHFKMPPNCTNKDKVGEIMNNEYKKYVQYSGYVPVSIA
jgi:hypothetical protein